MKHCLVLFAAVLSACASMPPSNTMDSGVPVERGPKAIAVDGDPNGLWWDDASSTLYIADDNGNRILTWRDGEGISKLGDLPAAPANGPGLGQLVRIADGTVVVTRFGGGTAGDVVWLKPDGSSGVVPNLAIDRRRIGLTVTSDGVLYDAYFVRHSNVNVGSIARLDLAGSETEVVGGLGKPVGVLAVGTDLFLSDQTAGKVLKAPVAMPMQLVTFATFPNPDLLASGPNGSLLTGSREGNVFQISSTGESSVFSGGYQQVRGVAYDAKNKRVFAADHDGDPMNGLTHFLQIIPVP